MLKKQIFLKKVNVHNLKSVDLILDTNELIVFTGVSGSGKSSLAFDTIYSEGQRRYVESLSTYARRQLKEMEKPDIEDATGIGPTIAIEQKSIGRNPRSTVGTLTEIYDYLRVLFARVAVAHCPISLEKVTPQSKERIIKTVQSQLFGKKIIIFSPYAKGKKGEFREDFLELLKKGYTKLRIDGKIVALNEEIFLDGTVNHDIDLIIDRLKLNSDNLSRAAESITRALELSKGIISVLDTDQGQETLFSEAAYSAKSGLYYRALEPKDFSFNSPSGSCERCQGLGRVTEFDADKVIDPNLSITDGCVSIASSYNTVYWGNVYDNLAKMYDFSVNTPWKQLSEKARSVFLYGTEKKWTRMRFVHPKTGSFWFDLVKFEGVLTFAHKRYQKASSDHYKKKMQKLMIEQICPKCKGNLIKAYPAAARLSSKTISDLTGLTCTQLLDFFNNLKLSETDILIASELIKEIKSRLSFLLEVGLHYLTLNRTAPTLSGGEAQRVRLASTIGSGLVGITYILDEPSIGLHPRDNLKLIKSLKKLKNIGNTVIVVEHDEETILSCDRVVDIGPQAGFKGGEIIVNGTVEDLLKNKRSITAAYLSGKEKISIPTKRRKPTKDCLSIIGAHHNNLKKIDLALPLGLLIAVTGVSGSGKSSLITDTLYPAIANHLHSSEHKIGKYKKILGMDKIDKIIAIDQKPIGRTPRSNPSTYIKLLDDIRDLFSQLNESRSKGYCRGRFSFNVKEGSCQKCRGLGVIKIDMDFLEDAFVSCPECKGKRFDSETLSVYYKGKNIYDILDMEVTESLEHFKNIPTINRKLETFKKVGLEYIKLGQSSTTLSGGEAQRIKLAKELVRPSTGKTLYILDEPTTGLHFQDISKLLNVLHELVERGNTVIIIEHNMDIIKTADWIIDLGPEGGDSGGEIIDCGTPEKLAKQNTPTGLAVKKALNPKYPTPSSLKQIKEYAKPIKEITIKGAFENNLKHINASIPREKITIFTGPSGSGKSSLAFDTIYAEGQRRYTETLSPYARQYVHQMPKPVVEQINGLSPAISIEQKASAGNPRSTVGTMTEIYDYLRLLWARIGIPHCPETGELIRSITTDFVCQKTLKLPENQKIQILAPIEIHKNESFDAAVTRLSRLGFVRVRLNNEYFTLDQKELMEAFDKKRKNELLLVIDRLILKDSVKGRLFEGIEKAAEFGQDQLIIATEKKDIFYNLTNAAEKSGKSYPKITPHTFSFNSPHGFCPDCFGLGVNWGADFSEKRETLLQTPVNLLKNLWKDKITNEAINLFIAFLKEEKIDPKKPIIDLSKEKLHLIMSGSDKIYNAPRGFTFQWIGINNVLSKVGKSATRKIKEPLSIYLDEQTCLSCSGSRLNPLATNVTIKKFSIAKFCSLSIDQAKTFINSIKIPISEKLFLEEIKKQILNRLSFLMEIGLNYISLDRRAPTISGGEAQRIRLARQLGSGLTNVLYVLDEPTIGLHPQNIYQLNSALKKLKDLGNTLILVEHDPQTIAMADYIFDFGPGAGDSGGQITAQGTLKQLKRNKNSLTGQFLCGKRTIAVPKNRRTNQEKLTIKKAKIHNLKNISIEIPIKTLTCITGVSGSGKSTILQKILKPAFEKGLLIKDSIELKNVAIVSGLDNFERFGFIDQNPPGHTHRSNVCTYSDVFTHIRQFFASLPKAQTRGLMPCHFSYNHKKGMCTNCWGMGYKNIEMYFLPAVKVVCDQCQGLRLNPTSLEIKYKNMSLGEHLNTTVTVARNNFENHPRIVRILDTLISCGLGYLKLGQEIATLSGGEAQRIKLSKELAKRSRGKTLYLLDEPTTGLHSSDIEVLLKVLHKLVDKGNSIIAIEHNGDFIKNSDYVIDMGPGAGINGGEVIFSGTPEDLLNSTKSLTAKFLKNSI